MASNCHGPQRSAAPHASSIYSEWVALHSHLRSGQPVVVSGQDLSIADVVAVSLHKAAAKLTDDPRCRRLVDDSVDFLARELESGRVIYGVNTGFGGSADTRTQDFEQLQSAAIQHLNVGVLLKADKAGAGSGRDGDNPLLRSHALPTPVVRAAMLIRCNSLMRGHSAVRLSVIESVMQLLSLDMTPVVPLRGSISASGDLSPLSYIAGAIEGSPDIFVRVGGHGGEPKVQPASEALRGAGLQSVRLQAKEGLGITNGTAPSCAAASIVMHQANQLALLTQLLTAMGTEALGGTANNYHPFISAVRPHPGQAEAARNILHFLSGSKICPSETATSGLARTGLAQDRYALRTAPQWIGPQLEDLQLATRQVATELNSTTDNPLIDAAGGCVHHGGNFQAAALTSAMEKTLTALQNLGRLLFAQASELANNATNRGLPPNLSAGNPSASFTAKGLDVNMAAYAAELAYLARPVSAHVHAAEMANQSVNSMALVAARYALEAVEVLWLMAATYAYELCQALDLRCLAVEFARRVEPCVRPVLARCFLGHDQEAEEVAGALARKSANAILARWDQLSHLDLPDRCRTAVSESLGAVLENVGELGSAAVRGGGVSMDAIREYQAQAAAALEECYGRLRDDFFRQQTTADFISPASKVVYEFIRKELSIPLNRGVEDHPPLLLRRTQCSEELALRGRIIGTMVSEIYEAMRRGELHDRIMEFGERAGLWD